MIRRSMSRRDSVEVISDVELTDSEVQTLTRKRRNFRSEKPLIGIIYKSKFTTSRNSDKGINSSVNHKINPNGDLHWVRLHGFLTGEWLIFPNPITFMPDSKINLTQCRIKEHRINGKGAILISVMNSNSAWVIRFKDRIERRKWLSGINLNLKRIYLNKSDYHCNRLQSVQNTAVDSEQGSQTSCSYSMMDSDLDSTTPSLNPIKKRRSNIFAKLKQTVLRKSKSFRS